MITALGKLGTSHVACCSQRCSHSLCSSDAQHAPPSSAQEVQAAEAGAQPQPATSPTAATRPPRICAAPGCGAMSGLKGCGGCGSVRYCSENCSRAHWREHRAECRRLQAERAAAGDAAAAVRP